MLEVFPLSQLDVNWEFYLTFTRKLTGKSVLRQLDAKNRKTDDYPAFISSLGELLSSGTDPDEVLRNPSSLLGHLFFSFIVIAPTNFLISLWEHGNQLSISQLDLEMGESSLFVVSANLSLWRFAIIDCESQLAPHDVCLFGNKIHSYFDSLGLGKIFDTYKRRSKPDGTIRLLPKLKTI